MEVVDLYHLVSQVMYYEPSSGKVIKGDEALVIQERTKNEKIQGVVDQDYGLIKIFPVGNPVPVKGFKYILP